MVFMDGSPGKASALVQVSFLYAYPWHRTKGMTKEQIDYVKKCISDNVHNFYVWGEWLKVRATVLRMDRYECQDCKKKGKYTKATTVHHNQFLRKYPELALEIHYEFNGKRYRNLVSLCHDCHEARHGYRKKEESKPLTEERWD